MSKGDETQQPQESSPAELSSDGPERIYIVPYPNVIFLYPTTIIALVAAVWLSLLGDSAIDPQEPIPVVLSSLFLGIFAFNMVVLSADFPRATSLTLFFVGSTLALAFVVVVILRPEFVPFVREFVVRIRPLANATFFWVLFAIMSIIFLIVKILVQFDYWEVRRNEVLHHYGFLSDLRRYPTTGLQVEKEISDVFEYCLMRSGRLIIRPQGESRSFVLENVPFISQKEKRLTRLLSSVKVKVQEQ